MDYNTLKDQASKAGAVENQTEVSSFKSRMATAGYHPARLVGFIERGLREQGEFKGVKKDDCQEVQLIFEVFGKDNIVDNEDGTKSGILIKPWPLAIKLADRAGYYKLFNRMRNGRDMLHMSECFGEAFFVKVEHVETKKDSNGKSNTYARIAKDDTSLVINPPFKPVFDESGMPTDDMIDMSDKVPLPTAAPRLFLFNQPTQEQWDSLFIAGEYTRKDKTTGEETTISKNWIQEDIKEAKDWVGSPMYCMLSGLCLEEPTDDAQTVDSSAPEKVEKPVQSTDDLMDDMFPEDDDTPV